MQSPIKNLSVTPLISVDLGLHSTSLPEPLEMQYEHIRQSPQAELNAALLQLLAVGTAPGIVWSQLKHTQPRQHQSRTSSNHTAYKIGLTQDEALSFSLASLYSPPEKSQASQTTMYM